MKFNQFYLLFALIFFGFFMVPVIKAAPVPKGKRYGYGTYFNPSLGACGMMDNDNSHIVALGSPLFDQYTGSGNPNHNTLCGKRIKINFQGKSVQGLVHDRCPECADGDVDMSPAMFRMIANQDVGRIRIDWEFMN
ncbi:hypothetical protein G9A89_012562 [Geosiphon pyriformis]|nr:hypothetical protein G9A89_012562 [Geosiphon pyriformis]